MVVSMFTAARGVVGMNTTALSRIHPKSHTTQEAFTCVRRLWSHSSLLSAMKNTVTMQRRLHSTIHEGDNGAASEPLRETHTLSVALTDSTPTNSSSSNANITAGSSGSNGSGVACPNKPDKEAMDNLLEEIQIVLSRPVLIGSLFRALSSTSRKTLAKNREPLEQLLLRYPNHFTVYRQKSGRQSTIYCAPPHLVPSDVHRMVLEEPPLSSPSAASPSTKTGGGGTEGDDINARILKHDPLAEKQQRINTVLQYIPNEWSPFTELRIPEDVRVKCMGKPGVKALQYFERYPQYFEVRQQTLSEHTFYVRRSLALQRTLEKTS